VAGLFAEEIAIEGEDHIGPGEIVDGDDFAAGGGAEAVADVLAGERIVSVPAGAGVFGFERGDLAEKCGGGDGFGEQGDFGAGLKARAESSDEGVPIGGDTGAFDDGGSVRVVEIVDGSLEENIAGAEAGGMVGITLELNGAAFAAGGEDTVCVTGEGHGGGVEKRAAGDYIGGLADVGDDLLGDFRLAAGKPGDDGGGGEGFEKRAAIGMGGGGVVETREFLSERLAEFGGILVLLEALPISQRLLCGLFHGFQR
jgi:hypothetical protein